MRFHSLTVHRIPRHRDARNAIVRSSDLETHGVPALHRRYLHVNQLAVLSTPPSILTQGALRGTHEKRREVRRERVVDVREVDPEHCGERYCQDESNDTPESSPRHQREEDDNWPDV